jgi:DNA invertase Pin-like site-specific DNA recombinase
MANRSVSQQLRVGICARVSTLNHGQDPTLQTRELREYCDRRTWQVVGEYVDVGISVLKRLDASRQAFTLFGDSVSPSCR